MSGKLSVDVPIGTLKSIWKQAQLEEDERVNADILINPEIRMKVVRRGIQHE
jgi:hypothetical protein